MASLRAVISIDRLRTEVLQFDAQQRVAQRLKLQYKGGAQHGNGTRADSTFYARVCSALMDVPEVLVIGTHRDIAEFKHFLEENRPLATRHVVGYEALDHPSAAQLEGLARKYFSPSLQTGPSTATE